MKELTKEQTELLFGEKLDSTKFTWDNYCGVVGVSVLTIFDDENETLNKRFICQGWCYSDSLIARAQKEGFAIMLWDKKLEEDVWCHVSIDFSTTLFCKYDLKSK